MFKVLSRTVGAALIVLLISLVTNIITARLLGPEKRGLYSSVWFLATFIGIASQLGFHQSLVLAKSSGVGRELLRLFKYSVAVVLLFSAGLALLFFNDYSASQKFIYIYLAVILTLNLYVTSVYQVDKNLKLHNLQKIALPVATLFSLLLAWLVVGPQVSAEEIFRMFVFCYGPFVLFFCFKLLSHLKSVVGEEVVQQAWGGGRFFRTSLSFYGTVLAGLIAVNIDKIYLIYLASASQFGFYSVAFSMSRILALLPENISTVLFSSLVGRSKESTSYYVAVAFRCSFYPLLGVAIALAMLGRHIIPLLFGVEFMPAVAPFSLLCVEAVIGGGAWTLAQHFNASGRPFIIFVRQFVSLVPLGVGLFLYKPQFGDLGAYLAALLLAAAVLRLVVTIYLFHAIEKVSYKVFLPSYKDVQYVIGVLKGYGEKMP